MTNLAVFPLPRSSRRSAPRLAARLAGLALALGLLLPGLASAQDPSPALDIQRFAPVSAAHGFVAVETARQLPALRPGVDIWFTYAHRPLQLSTEDGERSVGVVDGLFSGHLRGGFGFTDWAEIDVSLPFLQVANVGGAGLADLADGDTGLSVGDLKIEGRFRILPEDPIVGLAVIPFVTLPTGKAELYQTSGVPTVGVKVAVSKRWRYLHLGGHLGYRLKPGFASVQNIAADDEIPFGIGVGASPVPDWLDINVELVGVGVVGPGVDDAGDNPLRSGVHSPLELLFDARLRTPVGLDVVLGAGPGITRGAGTPAVRAFVGVGFSPLTGHKPDPDGDGVLGKADECPEQPEDKDGWLDEDGCPDPDNDSDGVLDVDDKCPSEVEDTDGWEDADGCPDPDNDSDGVPDGSDGCPDEAEDRDGFEDADGCPDPDDDGDGILDDADACPRVAEDLDGWEDEDGCAEPDNDGDNILDVDDLCPNQPENINGEKDDDGCPDDVKAVVSGEKIVILEKVLFVSGKDRILRRSYPVLDAVKATLDENPQIKRLRVEGHTDSRGRDDRNQVLSEKRSKAVMRWLVEHGIEPERLESTGYGETRPIDDNETVEGQQRNRRVEFRIIE